MRDGSMALLATRRGAEAPLVHITDGKELLTPALVDSASTYSSAPPTSRLTALRSAVPRSARTLTPTLPQTPHPPPVSPAWQSHTLFRRELAAVRDIASSCLRRRLKPDITDVLLLNVDNLASVVAELQNLGIRIHTGPFSIARLLQPLPRGCVVHHDLTEMAGSIGDRVDLIVCDDLHLVSRTFPNDCPPVMAVADLHRLEAMRSDGFQVDIVDRLCLHASHAGAVTDSDRAPQLALRLAQFQIDGEAMEDVVVEVKHGSLVVTDQENGGIRGVYAIYAETVPRIEVSDSPLLLVRHLSRAAA